MDQVDHSYYCERARTARDLAQRAVHPGTAAVHRDFAIRYENLVAELERSTAGSRVQAG